MESTLKKVIAGFKHLPEKNRKNEILIFVSDDPDDPTSDLPMVGCSTLANLMANPSLISYKDYAGDGKGSRLWEVKTIGNVTVLVDVVYLRKKEDQDLSHYSSWFNVTKEISQYGK